MSPGHTARFWGWQPSLLLTVIFIWVLYDFLPHHCAGYEVCRERNTEPPVPHAPTYCAVQGGLRFAASLTIFFVYSPLRFIAQQALKQYSWSAGIFDAALLGHRHGVCKRW